MTYWTGYANLSGAYWVPLACRQCAASSTGDTPVTPRKMTIINSSSTTVNSKSIRYFAIGAVGLTSHARVPIVR